MNARSLDAGVRYGETAAHTRPLRFSCSGHCRWRPPAAEVTTLENPFKRLRASADHEAVTQGVGYLRALDDEATETLLRARVPSERGTTRERC